MKKVLCLFSLVLMLTGCGEVKNYKALPIKMMLITKRLIIS